MFKFFQDRRRVRELAATGREPAAPEQQLVAVREISRLLPAEPAFEFIEDRAWNSRSLAVRSEACRVLLLSNTGRGLRGVLRQIVVERESRPPWSYWRDFGVPIQLQFLGREAVGSLELHGKFILKQMEVDGFEAGEEDANSLIRILQGMGSCAAGAVGRFSSSVSWHRKHSRRAPPATPAAPAPSTQLAASSTPKPPAEAVPTSGREVFFGRRTIERLGPAPRAANDFPAFFAPDVAALAAMPAVLSQCTFKCCHTIPNHPRPEPAVIQAWADALGSDLKKALSGGSPARQMLAPIEETGELILFVFWDGGTTRTEVERVGAAMQGFLPRQ
jgi:hypothetical protein